MDGIHLFSLEVRIIMLERIIKRSGEEMPFDASKIKNAIFKANVRNADEKFDETILDDITQDVVNTVTQMYKIPTVEQIQDIVEEKLIRSG